MSTETLEQQQTDVVKLQLVKAEGDHFKDLKKHKELSNGEYEPVFVYRYGVPFWLKSYVTGELEDRCYIFSKETNKEEFAKWLQLEMVYIPTTAAE